MIFMGDGGAKERKDAIARGLGYVAPIAMHGLHHQLEGRIDNAAGLFGVEVFDQLHGAFYVSKEGGDGLAFTVGGSAGLQGRLLGQNPFS